MKNINYFSDFINEKHNDDPNKTSVVMIVNKLNEILILKRSKTADWMPNKWSLVGGMVEKKESYLDAAHREVHEETSLYISKLKKIKEIYDKTEKCHLFFYLTKDYKGKVKLDFENSDYEWVNKNNYKKFDYVPNIKDLIDEYYSSSFIM
jgi:8-oxo-dGTP diphosphatase